MTMDRTEQLEATVVQLRQDLWIARDATIGATAELGTARAKVTELEALIHQLRVEVTRLDAELRSKPVRLAMRLAGPVRRARRLLG